MDEIEIVRAYHQRSKHQVQRYAAGPESLDWDAQPGPWRRYAGAVVEPLPLAADACSARWPDLFQPGAVAPWALDRHGLGAPPRPAPNAADASMTVPGEPGPCAADRIRQRRSAQRFDRQAAGQPLA